MDFQALTYDVCRSYVHDYTDQIGEDASKKILGWIRSRDILRLSSCCDELGPALSCRASRSALMQVEAFFKKNAAFAHKDVTRRAAYEAFIEAEEVCSKTNARLDSFSLEPGLFDPDLEVNVSRMQRYISSALGDFNTFLNTLPKRIKVTAGATFTRSRRRSLPPLKLSYRMRCTRRAVPYVKALGRYFGRELEPRVCESNRVEVVPKNWKTDRTIACEPEGNMLLQLAFDGYAKSRLLRRGIDLSDQSRNQEMARLGSIDGTYATVDLKAASDTVALNTVALLFPEQWFRFLDDVRCSFASGSFGCFPYQKFSSMGNGSTFAIETLVFAAACNAVGAESYVVYGDDIIVPTDKVEQLIALLAFLGFSVNQTKTHISGPFRESCGANWFDGIDITPFYLREWDKRKALLSHNVNGLAAISMPGGRLWELLRGLVHAMNLPLVPFNGDSLSGVFIDPTSAYQLRKLVTRHGRVMFKAMSAKNRTRSLYGVRSLFLWYLSKYQSPESPAMWRKCSRYTISSHKYVRKWVHWFPPVAVTPAHLYWWADFVTHASQ